MLTAKLNNYHLKHLASSGEPSCRGRTEMASNKNQHFVPRCYLRPFTRDGQGQAMNLYNVDRERFIEGASVKHQCSGDYFYGKSPSLENAIQTLEVSYSAALKEVLTPGYKLTDEHRQLFKWFWLFQHLRTEAAARRAVKMTEDTGEVIGIPDSRFRIEIRDAVQLAMSVFVDSMSVVEDLKLCLIKNRTPIPFLTSDNPAVLTNRWYLDGVRTKGMSFGLYSAGDILVLPLSPQVLCFGYDGDVYSIPHDNGWVEVRRKSDVEALNVHQFLNCYANIFVQDALHAGFVHQAYKKIESSRISKRHRINYAVLDSVEKGISRYKVVDSPRTQPHREAIIHTQTVHAVPASWPGFLTWRRKGYVFNTGTGLGYIRRTWTARYSARSIRKELA